MSILETEKRAGLAHYSQPAIIHSPYGAGPAITQLFHDEHRRAVLNPNLYTSTNGDIWWMNELDLGFHYPFPIEEAFIIAQFAMTFELSVRGSLFDQLMGADNQEMIMVRKRFLRGAYLESGLPPTAEFIADPTIYLPQPADLEQLCATDLRVGSDVIARYGENPSSKWLIDHIFTSLTTIYKFPKYRAWTATKPAQWSQRINDPEYRRLYDRYSPSVRRRLYLSRSEPPGVPLVWFTEEEDALGIPLDVPPKLVRRAIGDKYSLIRYPVASMSITADPSVHSDVEDWRNPAQTYNLDGLAARIIRQSRPRGFDHFDVVLPPKPAQVELPQTATDFFHRLSVEDPVTCAARFTECTMRTIRKSRTDCYRNIPFSRKTLAIANQLFQRLAKYWYGRPQHPVSLRKNNRELMVAAEFDGLTTLDLLRESGAWQVLKDPHVRQVFAEEKKFSEVRQRLADLLTHPRHSGSDMELLPIRSLYLRQALAETAYPNQYTSHVHILDLG